MNPLLLIGLILAAGVLYIIIPVVWMTWRDFRSRRRLRCPHRRQEAEIQIDAPRAAASAALLGRHDLSVEYCSLLKEGETCDQACIEGVSH